MKYLTSFWIMGLLWVGTSLHAQDVAIDSTEVAPVKTTGCLTKGNLSGITMAAQDIDNIHVHKLCSDARASTFLIWVTDSVRNHYHANHTEIVYILQGEGNLYLAGETSSVGPGDYVFMPKGMHHGVTTTSEEPLKVISVQTPEFQGEDRAYGED
jgi:mannose-6-phosphate isomerase-like protein (cupin superfamily)